jgi:phosphomannomutase
VDTHPAIYWTLVQYTAVKRSGGRTGTHHTCPFCGHTFGLRQLCNWYHRGVSKISPLAGEAGGVKVVAKSGWFVARPSGTEEIYKISAESFRSEEHLARIVDEAQAIVDATLASA